LDPEIFSMSVILTCVDNVHHRSAKVCHLQFLIIIYVEFFLREIHLAMGLLSSACSKFTRRNVYLF